MLENAIFEVEHLMNIYNIYYSHAPMMHIQKPTYLYIKSGVLILPGTINPPIIHFIDLVL